jgi:hypothetical protein
MLIKAILIAAKINDIIFHLRLIPDLNITKLIFNSFFKVYLEIPNDS